MYRPASATAGSTGIGVSAFRFDGDMPLASFSTALLTCLTYLAVVAAIKHVVNEKKKALDLKRLVTFYNFTMSLASGVLFLFLSRELLTLWSRQGFFGLFCDPRGRNTSGAIIVVYYINYLFKYVELADTVFLCLRFKQTPFIHVYHHAITLMLCWTQLTVQTCMQWTLIWINLFVHILLYAYYGLYEMKDQPPPQLSGFVKYLTTVQIVQFMIGLLASLGAMGARLLYDLTPLRWGLGAPCHGDWSGAIFGLAIIASYLWLFTALYRDRYQSDEAARKARAAAAMAQATAPASSADFGSTFSPHAKTTPPVTAKVADAFAACSALASQEDAFASTRAAWLRHPLIEADRRRWAALPKCTIQHHQQPVMPKPPSTIRRTFGTDSARL